MPKDVTWMGRSREDLMAFPITARKAAGHQLNFVQEGLMPNDFKPMAAVGASVYEIRIHDAAGAFRVMYVANIGDMVYVLHCFQKKTQKTAKRDLDVATARYKDILK